MAIPVEQVSRSHFHSTNADHRSKLEDVSVGVGNGYASSEQLNAHRADGRQFTHGTVGHVADATQSLQYRGVHIPNKSPSSRRILCLPTQGCEVRELRECCSRNPRGHGNCSRQSAARRCEAACDRIAQHWRRIRKHASNSGVRESCVAKPDIEGLYSIRDHAGVELGEERPTPLQSIKVLAPSSIPFQNLTDPTT